MFKTKDEAIEYLMNKPAKDNLKIFKIKTKKEFVDEFKSMEKEEVIEWLYDVITKLVL